MQDESDSGDSDGGRVLKQSLQIYEKSQWLKATFNKETKRFFRVPMGISALHREFKERFPVLQILPFDVACCSTFAIDEEAVVSN